MADAGLRGTGDGAEQRRSAAADRGGIGDVVRQQAAAQRGDEERVAGEVHPGDDSLARGGESAERTGRLANVEQQMDVVAYRFDYLYKDLEAQLEHEKFKALLEFERAEALSRIGALEEKYRLRRAELEEGFRAIVRANEPTLMPSGQFDRLFEIARQTYHDPRGVERQVLTPEEVRFLSIPKGSLDPDERVQIESHVIHSFNFLLQIPWTKEIREIPRIARAHHEKLNGTGYPYKLKSDEIPVQAKIMTICDMFDALSASDRPYKKAVPAERALDILDLSVKQNELDPELYQLFLEAKIFNRSDKR